MVSSSPSKLKSHKQNQKLEKCRAIKLYLCLIIQVCAHLRLTMSVELNCSSAQPRTITLQHKCLGLYPQPLAVKLPSALHYVEISIHSKKNTVVGLQQNYKINFNLFWGAL